MNAKEDGNLTASTRGVKKTEHCIRFIGAGKHSGAVKCKVSSLRNGVKIEPGRLYGLFTDIVKFVAFFSLGIVKFVAFFLSLCSGFVYSATRYAPVMNHVLSEKKKRGWKTVR